MGHTHKTVQPAVSDPWLYIHLYNTTFVRQRERKIKQVVNPTLTLNWKIKEVVKYEHDEPSTNIKLENEASCEI